MIDDEAVSNLVSSIATLPTDEWRARTLAFEALIESLPKPNDAPSYIGSGIVPWYRSHTAMRRLFKPLSGLLLDARSTVAKHTCQHLAFLITRVKDLNPPHSDTSKYLLKDLLPTVLALHAQTVKLIRGYVLEMMQIVIPLCRFKSGLPVLLERLRKDKSPDVREACVLYLRLIIFHWTKDVESPLSPGGEDQYVKTQEYLTPSICQHIGNGLARALMDQSQVVRLEARNAFEIFRFKYPDIWNQIVQKRDGILSKDQRLRKSIINAAMKADADGRTDYSNYYPAYDEGEDYDGKSMHSAGSRKSWDSKESFTSRQSGRSGYRDVNSRKGRSSSRQKSRTGSAMNSLPKRSVTPGMNGSNLPPYSRNGGGRSVQNGSTGPQGRSQSVPRKKNIESLSEPNGSKSPPPPPSSLYTTNKTNPLSPTNLYEDSALAKELSKPSNTPGTEITRSTSSTSEQSSSINNTGPKPNENYQVANQLLSAHKTYIDELMESLRTEMNTVREFEAQLVQSKSTPREDGLYGPSEDEVLKYFETVYGFLEKGTENGTKLREAMERVSRAEFQ